MHMASVRLHRISQHNNLLPHINICASETGLCEQQRLNCKVAMSVAHTPRPVHTLLGQGPFPAYPTNLEKLVDLVLVFLLSYMPALLGLSAPPLTKL